MKHKIVGDVDEIPSLYEKEPAAVIIALLVDTIRKYMQKIGLTRLDIVIGEDVNDVYPEYKINMN